MVDVTAGAARAARASGAVERDRPARPEQADRADRTAGATPARVPRFRGARAVAPLSPTTAVYDRAGRYPALFLFQVARPKPPPPPFGDLVDPGRADAVGGLIGRFAPRGPAAGAFLDARV